MQEQTADKTRDERTWSSTISAVSITDISVDQLQYLHKTITNTMTTTNTTTTTTTSTTTSQCSINWSLCLSACLDVK